MGLKERFGGTPKTAERTRRKEADPEEVAANRTYFDRITYIRSLFTANIEAELLLLEATGETAMTKAERLVQEGKPADTVMELAVVHELEERHRVKHKDRLTPERGREMILDACVRFVNLDRAAATKSRIPDASSLQLFTPKSADVGREYDAYMAPLRGSRFKGKRVTLFVANPNLFS